ncbi:MAG: NAD(P)-dependent oxidoreductase [Candidatus Bathyarchaeota archaeon]|nr:NAD(P)-dependent oxidoreductase [Candidatus Bathyarchaeota archaeon]
MRILITGAFGNIGQAVIEEAYKRHHEITVFEVDNKKTRKAANKYRKKVQVIFGDIRNRENVKAAVQQAEAVIHLAAIIPPASKKHRELTMAVNYDGTVNLIEAIKETQKDIPFVFTSSASVMGPTQLQNRLVNRNDPLVVTGNYEESKIKCETFLKENADNYLIFRLAGVLPPFSVSSFSGSFSLLEELFDMHPDMRLEMVMAEDIATALVTGAEKLKTATTPKNQAYILGGGKENGWQLRGREFLSRLFGALSLPVPDTKYFTPDINTYHLDWYDTKEAQQEFNYQNHTFEDYLTRMKKTFRVYKVPIILLRKYIMKRLVKMSPYQEHS